MTSSTEAVFRLVRGPRILARTSDGEVPVAEFPRSGTPALDTLRTLFAQRCLTALSAGFSPAGQDPPAPPVPLELLGLALTACDDADVAFAVLNLNDGLTPHARRALGEAWVLVQEAIGARRGPGSVYAQAARENRAALRAGVAADAVDRYAAALRAGAAPEAARGRGGRGRGRAAGGDHPVSGADAVGWLAGMRDRFRRALQLRPGDAAREGSR